MALTEHKTRPAIIRWVKAGDGYPWKINDNYENGVPDWYLEFPHRDFFLECKHIKKLPVRAGIQPDLSPAQLAWLERRAARRDDARVLITFGETKIEHILILYTSQDWDRKIPLDEVKARLLPAKAEYFLTNLEQRNVNY